MKKEIVHINLSRNQADILRQIIEPEMERLTDAANAERDDPEREWPDSRYFLGHLTTIYEELVEQL